VASEHSALSQGGAAASPFTPIANYAFLSNCHTGALVAPDGSVDWLCAPRFDSPSVFGALLDRGAGTFRFGPFGTNVPGDRIYEPGTNSLVTSWKTSTGWVVVRDALTMGPRRGKDTVTPHTRPPADEDADHALVRTAECIDGMVEIDLVCEPAFDYGRVPGEWTLSEDEHRGEAIGAGQPLVLQTDMLLGIEAGRARARHVLRAGETVYCALGWSDQARVPTTSGAALAQLEATTRFWRDWLTRAAIPDHELGPLIQRSALAIKGLTYMPTGATVAALTSSLPETPGGERNWDYRYSWIRDSTFLLRALHYLLLDWEADEFMQFMADLQRNDDGGLQIMYGIDGRRDLTESVREDLSGYGGARPVRVGTALSTSGRTTSSEPRLTRSCCTVAAASVSRGACGRSCRPRPNAPKRYGGNPTKASGRPAAGRSTMSRRSSCAGWRSTARPNSPTSAARASSPPAGRRPPRTLSPTSSSTGSTSAACCASTMRPTRSTPRPFWQRSSDSFPATTHGFAPPCSRSPTS
jgi:GH15 family glucan-1,4-alpha-glucosidase